MADRLSKDMTYPLILPQLQFTPFIYRNREVFRIARPYQLLAVYCEMNPWDEENVEKICRLTFDGGLHEYLIGIDSGHREPDEELNAMYIEALKNVIPESDCEIITLAKYTIETGHDPYPLNMDGTSPWSGI